MRTRTPPGRNPIKHAKGFVGMESPAPLWQKGREPVSRLLAAMGRITGVIGVSAD
ncbi:MAG: hypothetical protein OXE84_05435 [Rhodobacteraceae bacterium]|nr:hypothetical protein [Paracoccaceae bacterium]MCY4195557.1 hypothetical protein [Paracoccaceae bacterium]